MENTLGSDDDEDDEKRAESQGDLLAKTEHRSFPSVLLKQDSCQRNKLLNI
jgi:hypothetical protein